MSVADPIRPDDGRVLRDLGGLEQIYHGFTRHHTYQFCLVAHLDVAVDAARVAAALATVTNAHPLLGSRIEATTSAALGAPRFVSTSRSAPLRVLPPGTPWQQVVAEEQADRIDDVVGPLWRAALVPAGTASCLVLTFAHQATDGLGGVRAVTDLVAALGGRELPSAALPPSQEDAVAGVPAHAEPVPQVLPARVQTLVEQQAQVQSAWLADPSRDTPATILDSAGTPPALQFFAADQSTTAAIVRACRTQGASVHSALCVAATDVLQRRGVEFVRVQSPLDVRRVFGLGSDVVGRQAGTRTSSTIDGLEVGAADFWQLARAARAALVPARRPDVMRAQLAGLTALTPLAPETAADFLAQNLGAEVAISSLGRMEVQPQPSPSGDENPQEVRLGALDGPVLFAPEKDLLFVGAVTIGGRLRLVCASADPAPGFLPDVVETLAGASA